MPGLAVIIAGVYICYSQGYNSKDIPTLDDGLPDSMDILMIKQDQEQDYEEDSEDNIIPLENQESKKAA